MARNPDLGQIDVLVPNFKRRLSGVTATIVRLVPLQARDMALVAVAPVPLPDALPQVRPAALLTMSRRGPSGARLWHARRNTEMLAGLVLKHLLRKRLKLLFTSASQRAHTGYTKWLIARMDHVVATSQKTARYLDRPADVIRHGIDVDAFTPTPDTPAPDTAKVALRARLGLPDGVLVGCYGRIRAQKGTGDFLEAMLRVLPNHPHAHALIMGRATKAHQSYLADLRRKAAPLADRIHFLPEVPVERMADWYAALDLFVAPQRWEGFGLTPLEAMACGVPVVATDVGAFSELIAPGRTGTITPPEDTDALATAIGTLLSDTQTRTQFGRAARAHVTAHFKIEDEAAALIALYRRLLNETAPHA